MPMELCIHPDDARRLSRVKREFEPAETRPHARRLRLIWHDSPDHALGAAGLVLAEQRGVWRIERGTPGNTIWPPATPPPVLAEAPTRDDLSSSLPPGVAPVAAFEGHETIHRLIIDGAATTMTIWHGKVRAIAPAPPSPRLAITTEPIPAPPGSPPSHPQTEAAGLHPAEPAALTPVAPTPALTPTLPAEFPPAAIPSAAVPAPGRDTPVGIPLCRVRLDGPEEAVRTLGTRLAATLRATVPTASLATEAMAMLADRSMKPRRQGAPSLPVDTGDAITADAAFRHILGHLLDILLYLAPAAADGSQGTEPVHQMRVAVRRGRSAISVFRPVIDSPALRLAAAHLKDLGGRLGPTRDWDVFVTETLPEVAAAIPGDHRLDRLHAAAERLRQERQATLRAYLNGGEFRALAVELAWLTAMESSAPAEPREVADVAHHVLQRRWRKLTTAGKSIKRLDVPALHDLRLRAKRARYAAELFVPLFPGRRTGRYLQRLSRLQQHLGVLNDGAVAAQMLAAFGGRHGYARGLVLGFAAARSVAIRPAIWRAWKKFRKADPFWT